jgi:hypothetical protein
MAAPSNFPLWTIGRDLGSTSGVEITGLKKRFQRFFFRFGCLPTIFGLMGTSPDQFFSLTDNPKTRGQPAGLEAKTLPWGGLLENGSSILRRSRYGGTIYNEDEPIDGTKPSVHAIEPHDVVTGALGGQCGPEDCAALLLTRVSAVNAFLLSRFVCKQETGRGATGCGGAYAHKFHRGCNLRSFAFHFPGEKGTGTRFALHTPIPTMALTSWWI